MVKRMPEDGEAPLKTDTSSVDKNTTATADSSTGSKNAGCGRSDDEKSLEADDLIKELGDLAEMNEFSPPLRIVPGRLAGSFSSLQGPTETHQMARRRKSDSAALQRSGSRSPGFDGGSSLSSQEGVDTDILTDKMGTLELDLKEQQEASQGLNKSLSNLNTVTERMSEETLDDVHAFQDVKREGSISRGNSITTGGEASSNMLEPLDEADDEDSNDGGEVKITNMEDILEGAEEEVVEASSPSLPTC
jgi:hypothetical protein